MFSSLRQVLILKTAFLSPQRRSDNSSYTEFRYEFSEKSQDSGFDNDDIIFSPLNYREHQRRASSFESMGSSVQEEVKEERQGSVSGSSLGAVRSVKGTGFPEPLCPDRNTTLPHPDADTSLNATIEAHDDDLIRTHSRRSFLRSRHSNQMKRRSEASLPGPEKLGQSFASLEAAEEKQRRRKDKKSIKERGLGGGERVKKDRDSGVEVGLDGGSESSGSRSSMEGDRGSADEETRESKRGFLNRLKR